MITVDRKNARVITVAKYIVCFTLSVILLHSVHVRMCGTFFYQTRASWCYDASLLVSSCSSVFTSSERSVLDVASCLCLYLSHMSSLKRNKLILI